MNINPIGYLVILFLLCLGNCRPMVAQQSRPMFKWWVELTDKNESPFCVCRPAEFLSARALDRRARAGIAVIEEDLPVNPQYVRALQTGGAQLHSTSKWLNAVVLIADSTAPADWRRLPFVRNITYLGPDLRIQNPPNRPPKHRVSLDSIPTVEGSESNFGYAALQNSLLQVPFIQALGNRGNGIWVAVMDGGFTNTDTIPLFDSVALTGRLYPGHDFVERDEAVYEGAAHGTSVLSVMAGNLPGYFVGAAPEATYFLVKTEDTSGEFPVEETNWIAGAEWADSLGVDLINASLGYTAFTDTSLNHNYLQLNGHTAIGSRGARIAASKGMIVCNSAGNSGDEPWHYIGVPADAAGLIAVGAVQYDGKLANFSSVGPTADGRIKPDLVAPGDMVVVAGDLGTELGLSSGTSLASPMLVGALSSLWSAYPDKTAAEILDAVFKTADQANQPDNDRGYGLPDMARAWLLLGGYLIGDVPNDAREGFFAFDRDAGTLSFLLFSNQIGPESKFELRNAWGETLSVLRPEFRQNQISQVSFTQLFDLPAGFYQVNAFTSKGVVRLTALVWL